MSNASDIQFGTVILSPGEAELYEEFNSQITRLIRSLPSSMQTGAMLFAMEYTGISMGEPLDFFRRYYAPAWSVIHCIGESSHVSAPLSAGCRSHGSCAHAMAMFLHSLDDHLHDGQIPPSHLMLLIRSQAWLRMRESLTNLSDGVPGGTALAESLLDLYYSGISSTAEAESLDAYCDLFRSQMATWLIVPSLTALMVSGNTDFSSAVRAAYESFGIAWRLLDDLQDLGKDMLADERSAVYVALSREGRAQWRSVRSASGKRRERLIRSVADVIRDEIIIETITRRICVEMENAARIAEGCGMNRLAAEYHALVSPLK